MKEGRVVFEGEIRQKVKARKGYKNERVKEGRNKWKSVEQKQDRRRK